MPVPVLQLLLHHDNLFPELDQLLLTLKPLNFQLLYVHFLAVPALLGHQLGLVLQVLLVLRYQHLLILHDRVVLLHLHPQPLLHLVHLLVTIPLNILDLVLEPQIVLPFLPLQHDVLLLAVQSLL